MDRKEAAGIIEVFLSGRAHWDYEKTKEFQEACRMAIEALQEPEIVHCKDCKYWIDDYPYSDKVKKCELAGYMVGENGHCVYGKVEE